jgi:enoyl-CoA hydratase
MTGTVGEAPRSAHPSDLGRPPRAAVRTERRGAIGVITLDDPARRNALSVDLQDGVVAALDAFEADPEVRALVVTATPPVFCAGGDLDGLIATNRRPLPEIYRTFFRIADSPLPSVAAVTGHAYGAGMNFVLACDIAVAASGVTFDSRFLDAGIHSGGGFISGLQRAIGSRRTAAFLLLADRFDAAEAQRIGLIHTVVPDADATLAEAMRLAEQLVARPPALVARVRDTLRRNLWAASDTEARDVEGAAQAWSMEQPEFVAMVEGLRARVRAKAEAATNAGTPSTSAVERDVGSTARSADTGQDG